MPEWSNGADSKSVVRLVRTVGSNPTLSARSFSLRYRPRRRPNEAAAPYPARAETAGSRERTDELGVGQPSEDLPGPVEVARHAVTDMPVPSEYQRATEDFHAYLVDVRDTAGLWSTHVAYTMTQPVFQTFRRRLTLAEVIHFSAVLPAGLRALFVADWEPAQKPLPFYGGRRMLDEVRALRPKHNFSPDGAIACVAVALRRHVDAKAFEHVLDQLPRDARAFWSANPVEDFRTTCGERQR